MDNTLIKIPSKSVTHKPAFQGSRHLQGCSSRPVLIYWSQLANGYTLMLHSSTKNGHTARFPAYTNQADPARPLFWIKTAGCGLGISTDVWASLDQLKLCLFGTATSEHYSVSAALVIQLLVHVLCCSKAVFAGGWKKRQDHQIQVGILKIKSTLQSLIFDRNSPFSVQKILCYIFL